MKNYPGSNKKYDSTCNINIIIQWIRFKKENFNIKYPPIYSNAAVDNVELYVGVCSPIDDWKIYGSHLIDVNYSLMQKFLHKDGKIDPLHT